jgi:hypothetical protein
MKTTRIMLALLAVAAGCHSRPINTGTGPTSDGLCAPLAAVPRRIWRLSFPQIASSISDLLGMPPSPALGVLADRLSPGFFSDDSLSLDPGEAYVLDMQLDQIMSDAAPLIPGLAGCQPSEPEGTCATRFAQRFGGRAFRRPLGDDEVADLLTVYAEGRKQDFNTGISDMIAALFHAPTFLFRSEIGSGSGATTTLTAYEVASQLAYTLLGSTPDQALLDAAGAGRLDTAAGTAGEAARLLATEAVRRNVTGVVAGWMGLANVFARVKDPSLGVAMSDQQAVQSDLYTSAQRSVDDTLWGAHAGLVTDLLTFDHLFVNQRLASVYGLPFTGATPDDFVSVLAPDGQRVGLLTHPALLWGASDTNTTAIVYRSLLVRTAFACADPLPQPKNLEMGPTAVSNATTEIGQSDYRLAQPVCAACHTQIDPFGRVLEGFDPIGRPRTLADGVPVDATGDFSSAPPLSGQITGPAALAEALLADRQFTGCAAQQISSYVIGRNISVSATCEVRQLRDAFEQAGGTMSALLEQAVIAPFARTRATSP